MATAKLYILLFTAILFSCRCHGAELFQWHNEQAVLSPLKLSTLISQSTSARTFSVDRQFLKSLKQGDELNLNIINSTHHVAKVREIKYAAHNITHINAYLDTGNEHLPVIITFSEEQFFIRIVTPSKVWAAKGFGTDGTLVDERSLSPRRLNLQSDVVVDKQAKTRNKSVTSKEIDPRTDTDEMAHLGLLVVYSLAAQDYLQGDILTKISHLIEVTNQVYRDSGVHIELYLASSLAVDYSSKYTDHEALDHIIGGVQGAFAGVDRLREQTQAQMVVLIREDVPDGVCGLAWGNSTVIYRKMFAIINVNCSDTDMAHELGHIMGLAHSRDQGDEQGFSFPYAIGYRKVDSVNGFSTIMAYGLTDAPAVHKFSSPENDCFGLPCGIDRNNHSEGADASYALNQVRFDVENLTDAEPPASSGNNSVNLDTILDQNLKQCIEDSVPDYLLKLDVNSVPLLTHLSCHGYNITDLTGLEAFTALRSLNFSDNQIADISPVVSLTNLEVLHLSYNKIQALEPLVSLSKLKDLRLNDNQIESLTGIQRLVNLENLNISSNNISEISGMSGLVRLQGLVADNNNISDVDSIGNLLSLTSLNLASNNITNAYSLSNLMHLTHLQLSNNNLKDVSWLGMLTELKWLYLAENEISDISSLANIYNLEWLTLSNNPLTDISPLSSLLKLRNLQLAHASVSDIAALGSLYHLSALDLAHTAVDDIGALSQLASLKELILTGVSVTDYSPLFKFHQPAIKVSVLNHKILCWQLDYLLDLPRFDISSETMGCDASQDLLDEDNDGVANWLEVERGQNPVLHNSHIGELSFQVETISIDEMINRTDIYIGRQGGSAGEIDFNLLSKPISAEEHVDYVQTIKRLTFEDGEESKTVSIFHWDDEDIELTESYQIQLSYADDPDTTVDTMTVNILDNELDLVQWAPANLNESFEVEQGIEIQIDEDVQENEGEIKLTLTRSNNYENEVGVLFAAYAPELHNQAEEGVDFSLNERQVIFAANETSKTITINILDNDTYQGDRVFYVRFEKIANATSSGEYLVRAIKIKEDDPMPTGKLGFEQRLFEVGEADGEFLLPVVRSEGQQGEITVSYTVTGHNAIHGKDFVVTDGDLTFTAEESVKHLRIGILDNQLDDGDVALTIRLSAVNDRLLNNIILATLFIADDDHPPKGQVSFIQQQFEVDESIGELEIWLQRTGGVYGEIKANFQVEAQSAQQSTDFVLFSGFVTFAEGQVEKRISVNIVDDNLQESSESFAITLESEEEGVISGQNRATVVIKDDDNKSSGGSLYPFVVLVMMFFGSARRLMK